MNYVQRSPLGMLCEETASPKLINVAMRRADVREEVSSRRRSGERTRGGHASKYRIVTGRVRMGLKRWRTVGAAPRTWSKFDAVNYRFLFLFSAWMCHGDGMDSRFCPPGLTFSEMIDANHLSRRALSERQRRPVTSYTSRSCYVVDCPLRIEDKSKLCEPQHE